MFGLSLRSLRFRSGGFVASFLAMFLGATLLMSFGSLFDTGSGASVDATGRTSLFTMAGVVGGWGLILVTFAVTSTMSLQVRQRAGEMALLKSIGATPGQLGRMIVGEAAVLAVVAVLLAIAPAILGGRLLLRMLAGSGQVGADVPHSFGGFAIHLGFGITLVAATLAATITAWRGTRLRAAASLVEASTGEVRMGRPRIVAASLLLFIGLDLAVVTATVMRGKKDFEPMATAGPASIWFSIGLALLAPVLVRALMVRLHGPMERRGGVSGHLAGLNLRQRTGQMSTIVMPIILFTGIATGTLYMQSTENAVNAAAGVAETADYKNAETTNLIVIGMILAFAAIMLVNTLVAATTHRRGEFGRHRLVGATPRQVLAMVVAEGAVLTGMGVLLGTFASLFTIVPFSIARTGSPLPDGGPAPYLGVVATAAAIALLTSVAATRLATRSPAIEAVTG